MTSTGWAKTRWPASSARRREVSARHERTALAAEHPARLSRRARKLLSDPDNSLAFSAVSLWEIVVKQGLGRDDFKVDARRLWRNLLDNGCTELVVTSAHALALEHLPPLHRDPFDRMLLAQCQVEGITLLTVDAQVLQYPGAVQKA